MNTIRSTLLLVSLTLLLIFIGNYIAGRDGMVFAFLLSAAFNFFSYFYSDKLALAMYHAQPATQKQLPRAYEVVERVTAKQGLPMPKIYILPSESPNAFATGRSPQHASVAVTHGILQLLDDEELEGVLAHELGHVRNHDILSASIAATLAGAITVVAPMGYFASVWGGYGGWNSREWSGGIGGLFMIILAPIAATPIQLAISHSREFAADATGLHFTGNPYALARALQKLDDFSRRIPRQASPTTAHLFKVAPLLGGGGLGNLFSTHPPIGERIRRLIGRDHV